MSASEAVLDSTVQCEAGDSISVYLVVGGAPGGVIAIEASVEVPEGMNVSERVVLGTDAMDVGDGVDNWILSVADGCGGFQTVALVRYEIHVSAAVGTYRLRVGPSTPSTSQAEAPQVLTCAGTIVTPAVRCMTLVVTP
jgi:hypothetical protein